MHRLLAVAIGALDSYPDLLSKDKTQVCVCSAMCWWSLSRALPLESRGKKTENDRGVEPGKKYAMNLNLISCFKWMFRQKKAKRVDKSFVGIINCFDYFISRFQKLCNHLNFRHKMAQYAARDSIDLHCQVKQCCYYVILFLSQPLSISLARLDTWDSLYTNNPRGTCVTLFY